MKKIVSPLTKDAIFYMVRLVEESTKDSSEKDFYYGQANCEPAK
jgi:hypothetical protein